MASSQNPNGALATDEDKTERPEVGPTTEDILREKSKSKVVKVLSVSVYIAAVTGNGFLLSVFYLFMWDPQIHATRPSHMPPDYGWLGGPSRLIAGEPSALTALGEPSRLTAGNPSALIAPEVATPQALQDPRPPKVPYHRIMSTEFTNNVVNSYLLKNVPGSGINDGIGQAETEVRHGIPSSAVLENHENNISRSDQHQAAEKAGIQSKAFVTATGSTEDSSDSSSSFGGTKGKQKKPSEGLSSPYQRPQVLQT